ncbi:KIF1-binding protein [Cryptotermes secundus]|uniref:KIF-binding protein n=4 Tax=Cryptotermes secundus TaxID=105785 RepID=A0A2J7R8M2_9NEOP|nr:KIF1-binding protein [Cryptotermes secundus]PNF37183.1 KIF1-binding protein [Cryptotermes secundus]
MATHSMNKEVLVDLQEKYDKVRKLLDEDSKRDPPSEPYKSKYAASVILTDMKSILVKLVEDSDCLKFKAMLGVVSLNLGLVSVDTEELSTGEEQLMNCVDSLCDDALKPEIILILMTALNQLGILWSERGDPQKSKEYLDRAEKLYEEFTAHLSSSTAAVPFHDLFRTSSPEMPQPDTENMLERLYTLTMYYLAQVHGSLNDHVKSAAYCHTTLKRQLESKDFDPVDWALNSATLSQFFMEKNGFSQARHHLAAASYILDQYESDLNLQEGNDETFEAKRERLRHRSADVARCWAKYGLMLLSNSRERLMSEENENEEEASGTSNSNTEELGDVKHLWFTSLELSCYEDQITDKHILVYEDARKVFVDAQKWLAKAKQYYTLDEHASDCVQIVQDLSQLYKYLAFFEEDEKRQSRMHKRRVDHLESVLKELNPQYYLLVCRQLWYELGETYSDILDIKLQRLQMTDERPTPHALWKVNHLAQQSISNFSKFIESLRDASTKKMPARLNEDVLRPALIAYFRVGRLYSKIVTPDKVVQLQYLGKSLDAYQFLVDYCRNDEGAKKYVSVELAVCEDMVKLLPLKLEKLKHEVQQEGQEWKHVHE